MTQPMYRWNGTPLVIPCDPAIAEAYNRRCEQFIEAQVKHKEKTGKAWTISEPLSIPQDDEAQRAYNLVGDVINALVACCEGGIDFPENMVDETGLVRIN